MKATRFVGLDDHAATVAAAVAEPAGEGGGVIPSEPEAIRKLMTWPEPTEELRVCYEAGPCGHKPYRQLTRVGVPRPPGQLRLGIELF